MTKFIRRLNCIFQTCQILCRAATSQLFRQPLLGEELVEVNIVGLHGEPINISTPTSESTTSSN